MNATTSSEESHIDLACKHGAKEYKFSMSHANTVGDLKRKLFELTNVEAKRQKIIGITNTTNDTTTLAQLKLKKPIQKFMLVGTAEANLAVDLKPEEQPKVINDLDWDYDKTTAEKIVILSSHETILGKLKRRISKLQINFINEPRKGKKLCVLDIDYTIFDCKNTHAHIEYVKRPHLEEFLTSIYHDYDIAFWSQTSWRYLEAKLTEMGILQSNNYKVSFVVDKTAMFSVETSCGERKKKHQVKALQLIWEKLPEVYTAANTVHVDDLTRNFVMNPKNGIKVKAYKNSTNEEERNKDRELKLLKEYLKNISMMQDVREANHNEWRRFAKKLLGEAKKSATADSSSSTSSGDAA